MHSRQGGRAGGRRGSASAQRGSLPRAGSACRGPARPAAPTEEPLRETEEPLRETEEPLRAPAAAARRSKQLVGEQAGGGCSEWGAPLLLTMHLAGGVTCMLGPLKAAARRPPSPQVSPWRLPCPQAQGASVRSQPSSEGRKEQRLPRSSLVGARRQDLQPQWRAACQDTCRVPWRETGSAWADSARNAALCLPVSIICRRSSSSSVRRPRGKQARGGQRRRGSGSAHACGASPVLT